MRFSTKCCSLSICITAIGTDKGGREAYAYDFAGNVGASIDAGGNTICYVYNSMGKVCSITDQSGNTETFRYDKKGRKKKYSDRNGMTKFLWLTLITKRLIILIDYK